MRPATRLSVRGTLGALKVRATSDAGRVRSITLGVFVPKDASHERAFKMKASVVLDVRRFAIMNRAAGGTIAVQDVELRTLVLAELERECGIFLEVRAADAQPKKARPAHFSTTRLHVAAVSNKESEAANG